MRKQKTQADLAARRMGERIEVDNARFSEFERVTGKKRKPALDARSYKKPRGSATCGGTRAILSGFQVGGSPRRSSPATFGPLRNPL
jgi:hypothetical protein